jgi:hypothetical protein
MKTKLTILWASATLALAFANVPTTAGQGKAVIKTGRIASVPEQNVQLRADEEEELPDSIIVYSPTDEKMEKHIYLPGESRGQYTWENGAWKFASENPNTFYWGRYDRESYNKLAFKVQYVVNDGRLDFAVPGIKGSVSYLYSSYSDIKAEYDTNGNLTSLRIIYSDDYWHEYTVSYNAGNNPVSIEGWYFYDGNRPSLKALYKYNDYGYPTLTDSYRRDEEKETWISRHRETAEYDAQGKILFVKQYFDNNIKSLFSYEYYDDIHFSSQVTTIYNDDGSSKTFKEEWKYGADGKPEAYYYYENDELLYYAIFYYGDPSGNIPVSAGSNVWSSGGQLYIAAATNGAAQVYAVSGQLLKTVTLTAGQTTATPLPRGVYIVATGGKTWKVIL